MTPIKTQELLDIRSLAKDNEKPDFSKTNIEELSKNIVVPVLIDGTINPLDAYIVANFWGKVMEEVQKRIKDEARKEALKYDKDDEKDRKRYGVTFLAYDKKGDMMYGNDPVIKDLQDKIEARKILILAKEKNPASEIVDTLTGITVEKIDRKKGAKVLQITHNETVEDVGESKPAVMVLQVTHGK